MELNIWNYKTTCTASFKCVTLRAISALLTMPKPLTVWITRNWKIVKEMGIPDHLTCLLRNLYGGQEATVRTGRFGRMALKHVKYHVWNEWPVQVRCTILDAWGWCTGTTQRDGMGREEGSGWGTHVYLWWIHFDIWQNQYNIVS